MNLENALGDIKTNHDNLHVDSSLVSFIFRRSTYGTSMPMPAPSIISIASLMRRNTSSALSNHLVGAASADIGTVSAQPFIVLC